MNRLYKNWAYLLASSGFSTIISFFAFIFLTKKLSTEGYGSFNTLIATVTLFTVFVNNIAAGTVVNREIVSQPKAGRDIFRKASHLRASGFVLASIALMVYQYLGHKSDSIILVSLVVLLLAIVSWDLCEQIAFGYFVTKFSTLFNISGTLIWLLIVVIMPLKYSTLRFLFLIYTVVMLIESICYWLYDKKRLLDNKAEKSNVSTKQLFKMSMPFFWMRIVGSFGDQIPILLLNGYSGASEVAYYSVGVKFVLPITVMINTGISALFPFLTKLYKEDIEAYKKKAAMGFSFVFIFGSTVAAFLTVTSSYWLVWIMGERYINSVEAFNYQVWFAVCLGFDLILSMIFSSSYRQKILAIITTIDLLILIPILYLALPFGAKGVAVAKLISALISIIYHLFVVFVVLKIKINNSSFYLSCIYFVSLLMISIFVNPISVKCLLFVIIIFIYMVFKDSPLRRLIRLISDKLKNMKRSSTQ